MSTIDEVKNRIDIVDLVSETVKLRRTGKNYTGFCPFHQNTRTPAFVVFPDSGTWRCFGQCNEGGDIFHYVMKKEGWDFAQSLQYLAEKAGVELEPRTPEKKAEEDVHERLRALLEETALFFRHNLISTPGGKAAADFLKRRGLQPDTIETFGLGYAPDSWEAAVHYLTAKGYTPEELILAGVASRRDDGSSIYDRFRNRVMFPIRDASGKMAGFGARILDPNDVPKFLNSPQTALFDKGRLLYGLDAARKPIRARDQVVIVEGYLDVIVLHQAGYTNTVSPMGTALTEDQLRLLKRFTRRIVLALDADAAGQKATLRGLETARQAMDRSSEIAFDARGLLRSEGRLQADLRVTTIPEGMDPDEVVLQSPEEWGRILEAAQPIVVHVMETLVAGREIDDPKVKSEIANQVLPIIEDVPDPVEREAYRQRLARLLRVDERSLVTAPARPARRPGRSQRQQAARQAAEPERPDAGRERELHVLRLLAHQPEALYTLDRALQKFGLSRFGSYDFENTGHQLLAKLMVEALEQDQYDPLAYVEHHVPEALAGVLEAMRQPFEQNELTTDKLIEDLIRTIILLRKRRIAEGVEQLLFMQKDMQEQAAAGLDYLTMVNQYNQTRSRLEIAEKNPLQFE